MCACAGFIQTKNWAKRKPTTAKEDWHRTASVIGPSDHVVMISVTVVKLGPCEVERVEIDVVDVDGSARLAATICVGHDPDIEVYRGHVFHVHWKTDKQPTGVGLLWLSFGFRLRFSYHKVCIVHVLYCLCLIVTSGSFPPVDYLQPCSSSSICF